MEFLIFGIVLMLALYLIVIYNRLIALKHGVDLSWSNIDVLLKQRHDELPKLVEVCKQYRQFEETTLLKIAQARGQVQSAREQQDIVALGAAESALRSGLGRLFAVAEAYPDLKSNANFMQLQSRISALESSISDRREFFNEAVNLFNVRIELIPDVVVARMMGLVSRTLFQVSEPEKQEVALNKLFTP